MNLCDFQQNSSSSMEEMKSPVSFPVVDYRDDLVCPKPRRFCLHNPSINEQPFRSFRRNLGHHADAELFDSKTGTDLLDILLLKGGCGLEQSIIQLDSTPPFFCGSPPNRVANPLIQDARFGDENMSSLLPSSSLIPPMSGQSLPSSPARKGGYFRSNFGNNPAVRVEGFDCLKRDRGNCSIPALA